VLLQPSAANQEPLAEVSRILERQKLSIVTDAMDRKRATDAAWRHMTAVGSAIDARVAIPALLEASDHFYYGTTNGRTTMPWLGPALKTAMAVLWPRLNIPEARMRSYGQVQRLVHAAAAWMHLDQDRDHALVFNYGPARVHSKGTHLFLQSDLEKRRAWDSMTMRRGLAQRTLNDSSRVIWKDVDAFMAAASEVLNGVSPTALPLFQGTVFEHAAATPAFWLGLNIRLILRRHAMFFRAKGSPQLLGISLFETFGHPTKLLGGDEDAVRRATQNVFWTPDWFAQRSRGALANMIVERPVLRIDPGTFATSTLAISDSINAYVEQSVFRFHGFGGVPLPEECFRRQVSQPFEDKVVGRFRAAGWQAGSVSETGWWAGGERQLQQSGQPRSPGEIDVLALHPGGKRAVLAECKVLSSPYSQSKLVNLVGKLGGQDAEGFHRKLNDKLNWLRNGGVLAGVEITPVLVVDQAAFLAQDAPGLVLEPEDLAGLMQ
jgi:hypothetical protein